MMKKVQLSLALLLCTLVGWAQMVEPVKWSHKVTVEGQNLVVTFTASINPLLHKDPRWRTSKDRVRF